MKTLEELGISPIPWTVAVEDRRDYRLFSVEADNGAGITDFDCCPEQFDNYEGFANASLIAAAPDQYKCLYDARPNYVPFSFRLDKYQPPRGLKKGDVVNVKFRIYGSKTLDKPARAFHMTAARMTIVYQAGMFARCMEADE